METIQKRIFKFWDTYMQPVDVMALVLLTELAKGMFIIQTDKFRDGDLIAYLEQSSQFVNGERNLSLILGRDTGW